MEILCFWAGIALIYIKSAYPLGLIFACLLIRGRYNYLAWFIIAIFYAFSHQWQHSDQGFPSEKIIAKAEIEGEVISIPLATKEKTQFQFLARRLNDQPVKAIILLACYNHCPLFKAGEFWHFQAKIKQPQNLANPGSFDYASWLDARHIHWVGYLKPSFAKRLSSEKPQQFLLRLREHLATRLVQKMSNEEALGILQALSLGLTTHIDKAQWQLFRQTGTTHLMVISGAHIGLIAGFSFKLIKIFWSRIPSLCLRFPATQAASIAGLTAALSYALLAGFAPPAQRAVMACFFLFLRYFLSSRLTAWQTWRYALLAVLLYEPHCVLLPGFYLSFIAVAILIFSNQRLSCRGFKKVISLQLACLIGLMPLTLYWFSYGAINGLLANLLAIPLVSFIVVPLALLSTLVIQVMDSSSLLLPVTISIKILLVYLKWVDSFSEVNLQFSFATFLYPLALMIGMGLCLLLPLKKLLLPTIALIISALFPGKERLKQGELRVNILDVGQGLAVVVSTANHHLIYDTGMKFYQGSDMGKLAIIPFLDRLGVSYLDKIVISHPDLDHRGGLFSLEEKYPVKELLVNQVSYYHRGKNCHQFPAWKWDGVSFRFLPITKQFKDKNNSSCILKIENKAGSLLLVGDIEKLAEDYLVETYAEQLKADVLIIPHHGSKTSSSYAFIKQVAPKQAVISAGFDNRYHFPHQQTIDILKYFHINTYNTANRGMITAQFSNNKKTGYKLFCYQK